MRRPDIQGLRAIAVLMVVAYHAGMPLPGGFLGVDVFFVISGFVITAMLLGGRNTRFDALGPFYVRRLFRLVPALAVVIAATMLASIPILSPLGTQQVAAQTGLGSLLLVANVVIAQESGDYFGVTADLNPLLNTWSLSVEEQFYLLFPALLLVAFALATKRAWRAVPALVVAVAGAFSFMFAMLGAYSVDIAGIRPELLGFYSPVSRAWEFAAGALLALAPSTRSTLVPPWLRTIGGGVGLLLILLAALLVDSRTATPGPTTMAPVFGTVLLLWAGSQMDSPVRRALSSRSLVKIGDGSYSVYLWHWPVITLAVITLPGLPWVAVAAAAASFGPAFLTHRYVEQPLRSSTSGAPRRRQFAWTSGLVLVAGGCCIAVLWGAQTGFGLPRVQAAVAIVGQDHAATSMGCASGDASSLLKPGCQWHGGSSGAPLYLIGDSHADHLSETVIGSASVLDRPVRIATSNACPPLGVTWSNPALGQDWNERCREFNESVVVSLKEADPGIVILAMASGYFNSPNVSLEDGEVSGRSQASAIEAGLIKIVSSLKESGHEVLLIQDIPPYSWDPRTCNLLSLQNGDCSATIPRQEAAESAAPDRQAIERIAASSGANVADLLDALCPQGRCSTDLMGTLVLRDGGHLSVAAAEGLVPWFTRVLRELDEHGS